MTSVGSSVTPGMLNQKPIQVTVNSIGGRSLTSPVGSPPSVSPVGSAPSVSPASSPAVVSSGSDVAAGPQAANKNITAVASRMTDHKIRLCLNIVPLLHSFRNGSKCWERIDAAYLLSRVIRG